MWINIHKPTNYENIFGNDEIIQMLKKIKTEIPNMIIFGQSGVGKKSLCDIIIKNYLGDNISACYKIYGSIYRSKNVISEYLDKTTTKNINDKNINKFIKKRIDIYENGKVVDKYKIIVIYDFHCMVSDAQNALRRIIELNINKVRFIFITDNLSKIIEPIQSRLTLIHLHNVSTTEIVEYMKNIHKAQNIRLYDDDVYYYIGYISNNDMRLCTNYLNFLSYTKEINLDIVKKIINIPSYTYIENIFKNIISKNITTAIKDINKLFNIGYENTDIFDTFIKVLISSNIFDNEKKLNMINEFSKILQKYDLIHNNIHIYNFLLNI